MKSRKQMFVDMRVVKIAPHTYRIDQGDYRSYGTKGGMLAFNEAFEKAPKLKKNDKPRN